MGMEDATSGFRMAATSAEVNKVIAQETKIKLPCVCLIPRRKR
jgi:hypothetical protein